MLSCFNLVNTVIAATACERYFERPLPPIQLDLTILSSKTMEKIILNKGSSLFRVGNGMTVAIS